MEEPQGATDPAGTPDTPGPTETPAPAAAQTPGAEPEGQVAPGEREPDGAEPEGAPPAWSEAADLDSLMEVAEVKGHVELLTTRAREEAEESRDQFWRNELRPSLEQTRHSAGEVNRQLRGWGDSWNKYLEDHEHEIDYERMDRLYADHRPMFDLLRGLVQEQSREETLAQVVGHMAPDAAPKQKIDYIRRMKEGDRLAFEELLSEAAKPLIAKQRERWDRDEAPKIRANVLEELRNGERQQGEPVPSIASGKGGQKLMSRDELAALPRDEIMKIPEELRDRILAGS